MLSALLLNFILVLLLPIRLLRRAFAAPRGAYVLLSIDGRVVDHVSPKRTRLSSFLSRRAPPPLSVVRVRELCALLAKDTRIAGLVVRIQSLSAGPSVLASLRKELLALRTHNKDLVFDLPMGADNDLMYLASAGKRIVVGPETSVAPIGYAAEARYVRRALQKLGITAEVFAKGTYKSAAEPLVLDAMSDAQREQLGELLKARHDALVDALAARTGGDKQKAASWIDEAPHRAVDALRLGLVDAVVYEDGLDGVLGAAPGESVPLVDADDYLGRRRPTRFRPFLPRPVVGLVEVHGPIVSTARFAMGPMAIEEEIVSALRLARANKRLAAVVLHIDSPGGSALASDRIHHEVERLAEVKPIVAYLSNVAASGGYYVAAGARLIVAEPETVTGSIGVVSAHFVLRGLFDKLGVTTEVVKAGARADLLSPTRPVEEDERRIVEAEIDGFYRTFLNVVARGRKRPVHEIEKLAEGRVYSGRRAQELGLVDELGSCADAVRRASEFAGVALREPVLVRPPHEPMPPAPMMSAAKAVLGVLGCGALLSRVVLGVNLHARERVLVYAPLPLVESGSDGRTGVDSP